MISLSNQNYKDYSNKSVWLLSRFFVAKQNKNAWDNVIAKNFSSFFYILEQELLIL